MTTAKLRHIAISVPDLEASAAFYEQAFGLKRVNFVVTPYGDGLSLSDGVINLTLLKFHTDDAAGDERGKDFVGIHHMGFIAPGRYAGRLHYRAHGAAMVGAVEQKWLNDGCVARHKPAAQTRHIAPLGEAGEGDQAFEIGAAQLVRGLQPA